MEAVEEQEKVGVDGGEAGHGGVFMTAKIVFFVENTKM